MSLFRQHFMSSNRSNNTNESKQVDESIFYIEEWNKICGNNMNFNQESQINCNYDGSNIINKCGCCQRILIIFKYSQKAKQNNKIYSSTFGIFPGYDLTQFQNDMDHIMIYHDFEVNDGIFIDKIGVCDIGECRVPARESRNGVKSPRINQNNIQCHNELKQIIRHLFIEEFHGYLLHPIKSNEQYLAIHPDRDNRFVSIATNSTTKNENNNNNNKLQDIDDAKIIETKSTFLDTVMEEINQRDLTISDDDEEKEKYNINNKSQQNKPIINNNDDNDDEKEEKEEKDDDDDDDEESGDDDECGVDEPEFFKFGHKFSYHRFKGGTVSVSMNYVGCKYENLKKELIDDPIKRFDINKWNILISHCTAQSDKDYCKNILIAKSTKYGWNTEVGKSISIARIVAIELYTNFDSLQSALCETYRMEVDKKKQKQAHSRFAHWAKLLRSTVDIFGEKMQSQHLFYRGLTGNNYVFSLFSAEFNAPCSTTTKPGVAWSFAVNGIVLQIEKADWRDGARFMNVKHLSAYKTEEEHLFIGPDNFLKITSIHHNMSVKKTSTEPLLLLQKLTYKISRNKKIDMAKSIKSGPENILLLYEWIENRNNSRKYEYQLTEYFVNKKTRLYIKVKLILDLVKVTIKETNQKNECQNLLSWLIDGDIDIIHKKKQLQINFDGINKLFPNTTLITFDFRGSHIELFAEKEKNKNNKTWDNIIEYMYKYWSNDANQTKNRSKVCKIIFQRLHQLPSNEFMDKMKDKLKNSRWSIYAQKPRIIDPSQTSLHSQYELIFYRGSYLPLQRKEKKRRKKNDKKSDKINKKNNGHHHHHQSRRNRKNGSKHSSSNSSTSETGSINSISNSRRSKTNKLSTLIANFKNRTSK